MYIYIYIHIYTQALNSIGGPEIRPCQKIRSRDETKPAEKESNYKHEQNSSSDTWVALLV